MGVSERKNRNNFIIKIKLFAKIIAKPEKMEWEINSRSHARRSKMKKKTRKAP